jgi:hypothetical protein
MKSRLLLPALLPEYVLAVDRSNDFTDPRLCGIGQGLFSSNWLPMIPFFMGVSKVGKRRKVIQFTPNVIG